MSTVTGYVNGPSLESATAVFLDSALTTCAPDGFYQQDGIVREQVGCVLLPQSTCASCAFPCGEGPIIDSNVYGWTVFKTSIELGPTTGAVIITVNPQDVPDGVMVIYNSVVYNKLSSPTYGYLAAPAGQPTYIGKAADDCGLVQIYPYTFTVFRYNGNGYDITGGTEVQFIVPDQLQLTANGPGDCIMVIPKPTAGPSVVEISIYAVCPVSSFEISIACPAPLTGFSSTSVFDNSGDACAASEINFRYSAPVNGSGSFLGLYDYVFSDSNGQLPLADGYYHSPDAIPVFGNGWFRVANGLIQEFGSC